MSQLVPHLDWGSLLYFSQVGRTYHKLVLSEIGLRIKTFLSRFIPTNIQPAFWALIEETNSCVFGGIVRAIMMAGNDAYYNTFPPQLDVIVPINTSVERSFCAWTAFWASLGYTKVTYPAQKDPFESCTRDIKIYTRPVL
jgi:hypothetical protein